MIGRGIINHTKKTSGLGSMKELIIQYQYIMGIHGPNVWISSAARKFPNSWYEDVRHLG
jgi:hypothetical protein